MMTSCPPSHTHSVQCYYTTQQRYITAAKRAVSSVAETFYLCRDLERRIVQWYCLTVVQFVLETRRNLSSTQPPRTYNGPSTVRGAKVRDKNAKYYNLNSKLYIIIMYATASVCVHYYYTPNVRVIVEITRAQCRTYTIVTAPPVKYK